MNEAEEALNAAKHTIAWHEAKPRMPVGADQLLMARFIVKQDRERRFANGERICVECGKETPDTYGGLCSGCDALESAADEEEPDRAGPDDPDVGYR